MPRALPPNGEKLLYLHFWSKKQEIMQHVQVKIVNRSGNELPTYSTPLSAGMDLRANLDAPVTLQPLERRLIPTGIFIQL